MYLSRLQNSIYMKRRGIYLLIGLIILAIIATAVYYVVTTKTVHHVATIKEQVLKQAQITKHNVTKRGNVLIIVYPYFRWEEYYAVVTSLEKNGYNVYTLCMSSERYVIGIDEKFGRHIINCDINGKNINMTKIVNNFIGVVYIGGPGLYCILDVYGNKLGILKLKRFCIDMLNDYVREVKHYVLLGSKIAREMYYKGKIVAAICVAPTILAISGILRNKPFTMYKCNVTITLVKHYNCTNLVNTPVVVSGRVITGSGPLVAKEFAEEVVKVISSR